MSLAYKTKVQPLIDLFVPLAKKVWQPCPNRKCYCSNSYLSVGRPSVNNVPSSICDVIYGWPFGRLDISNQIPNCNYLATFWRIWLFEILWFNSVIKQQSIKTDQWNFFGSRIYELFDSVFYWLADIFIHFL